MSALEDDYERLFPATSSSQKAVVDQRNSNNMTTVITTTNNVATVGGASAAGELSESKIEGMSPNNTIKVERGSQSGF